MGLDLPISINKLSTASKLPQPNSFFESEVRTSYRDLNIFLKSSIQYGQLNEFGIPWGNGGREIIIDLISVQQKQIPPWCLWVHGNYPYSIYPPAWAARGIRLEFLKIAHTDQPMEDLKEAL